MLSATKADRLATSLSRYVPEAEDAPLLDELSTYLDQRLTALEHDFAGTPSPSSAAPAPVPFGTVPSAQPSPSPAVPVPVPFGTVPSVQPSPSPAQPILHSSFPRSAPPILHSFSNPVGSRSS